MKKKLISIFTALLMIVQTVACAYASGQNTEFINASLHSGAAETRDV